MPTNIPYCTLADVKLALGIDSSITTDDAFLASLIPAAQNAIDCVLGYSFQTDGTASNPTTKVFDGSGKEKLLIDELLVLSQVKETVPMMLVNTSGTLLSSSPQMTDITHDCFLGPPNTSPSFVLLRQSGLPFTAGYQNYVITGVWGYDTIPADISRACVRLTAHYFKMRDSNYADSITDHGGVRLKYTREMPPDVVEIVERYRRRSFLAR